MIIYASPVTQGVDIDGNTEKVSVVGAEKDELRVSDMEAVDLLEEVIKQLRIMNVHLSVLSDLQVDKKDLVNY